MGKVGILHTNAVRPFTEAIIFPNTPIILTVCNLGVIVFNHTPDSAFPHDLCLDDFTSHLRQRKMNPVLQGLEAVEFRKVMFQLRYHLT